MIGVLLVSLCGILCVSASDTTKIDNETFEYVNNISEMSELEEKILCDATVEDDFEDDSIIVVFKNSKSLKLNAHTTKSFPEISSDSVKDLTSYTKSKVLNQRNKKMQAKMYSEHEVLSSNDEMYVDENMFHQIVKIDLKVKSKENVLKCIKKLETRQDVLMVFPNYIYKPITTTNDPAYQNGSDWAIEQIDLPEAWNISSSSKIINVGVIDSGIEGDHEDLVNVVNNTLSKDFTGGNSPLTDEHGHGTAMAGVIGAESNNAKGVTGTCNNVSLVSLKAAKFYDDGSFGMSLDRLADAIDYAIGNNIPILNYSYYGEDKNNDDLKLALGNYNGLFVCAAGNKNKDITDVTISTFGYNKTNTIVVAGSDEDDKLFSYISTKNELVGSNYSTTKVHLAAPGYKIGTTSSTTKTGYDIVYGTSVAAPFVTGVAALLKSEYPDMSAETIKYYIEEGVDEIDALGEKVATGGRLNAFNALNGVKTYTVEYDANGGTGTMSDTEVIYKNITNLSKNKYTYPGAEFAGWHAYRHSDKKWYYTNGTTKKWFKEGTETAGYYKFVYEDEVTVSKTSSKNNDIITMVAQWDYDVEINFNANTGSGTMNSITADFTKTTNLPTNTFTKSGYRFDHWYVKNEYGETLCYSGPEYAWYTLSELPYGYYREKISNGGEINKNIITERENGDSITLYAYWEPINAKLGDVDKNGFVGHNDVTLVQNYLSNTATLTAEQKNIADVNYSNSVTVKDATLIQKFVNGQIKYFVD